MKQRRKEIHWVLQAQSGDTDALNALLNAVQDPVYRYIFSLVNDEHLAYDILQEVFMVVVRKIYWIRDARAFRSWIYRIASREAFHSLDRERRMPEQPFGEYELEAIEDVPNTALTEQEMSEGLLKLVNQVSSASRAVLSLHYLQGMTLQEVAEILGVSIGTAKSRLSYGLATLRELLSANDRNEG